MKKYLKIIIQYLKSKKQHNKKYVFCFWQDANTNGSWISPDDASNGIPAICLSTGWLWKKDNVSTVIVSDLGFDISSDGTSSLNEVGNSTTIPTMNIVKMIYINVDTKKL
jgi:hypothetical protein